ncbi:MAG: ATP-binding protein [Alphaproteobacteria bacterium]|nr:ATP-binding protein [Alphaproteobacteria bacterium]
MITEVLAVLGSRAEAKKQRFAMTADAELSIHSDPRLLKAILINLVNNSIKFSPENKEIRVIATRDADTVKITVSDQGIGIPADQITRLFRIDSPFKRKGTNNEPGTGLGLIMCQEYVTLLGGSIRAESTEGTGSNFVINLPL